VALPKWDVAVWYLFRQGELAYRAVSYTPWPVEEGFEGERVRLSVGPINDRQPRTFVFNK
jgi:hypothetical protein